MNLSRYALGRRNQRGQRFLHDRYNIREDPDWRKPRRLVDDHFLWWAIRIADVRTGSSRIWIQPAKGTLWIFSQYGCQLFDPRPEI